MRGPNTLPPRATPSRCCAAPPDTLSSRESIGALFHAGIHREDEIAVPEADLAESGRAQPFELIADGCGAVQFHPLQRLPEVVLVYSQFARAPDPCLMKPVLQFRRFRQHAI